MAKNHLIRDVAIIGAGPAGLTAAIYLSRFRRNFHLIDNQNSRAALIPTLHNYPGFPEGINGKDLLNNLRQQAEKYGTEISVDTAKKIERNDEENIFKVSGLTNTYLARAVLLYTGVMDIVPDIPQVAKIIQQGLMRQCPVCDGYEVINKKIGVIGYSGEGFKETCFIRNFTADLTLFVLDPDNLDDNKKKILSQEKIKVITDSVVDIKVIANQWMEVHLANGEYYQFDSLYSALGADIRTDLAIDLDAKHNKKNCLIVDDHQRTNIPLVYAAGDNVAGLSQICVATGQAAIAATDIHNSLLSLDKNKK